MSPLRGDDRQEVSFPATVTSGDRVVRDVITNVSASGFYLRAERQPWRTGERVRVTFSLPVGPRLVPLEVDGVVARVERDATHRVKGIAIRMVSPPAKVRTTVDAYLAGRDRLGGSPRVAEVPEPATDARLGIPEDEDEITESVSLRGPDMTTLTGFDDDLPDGDG